MIHIGFIVLKWLVPIGYLISFYFYLRNFRHRDLRLAYWATHSFLISLILHFLFLIFLSIKVSHMPLGGAGQAVTSAVFLFGIVYYALEYKLEIKTFSVFILPVIIFLQLLATFQLRLENELPVILQNLFFEIHVIFNLLAYSSFAISFISSLMYLLLFYEIQGERMGFFYSRLPSLKLVDTITNKANVVGFLALSIGMLLGIMMALKTWTAQWELDPKLISILMIWMIYALVIISRFKMGWEGKRTAWISFFGFGGILFSFLVITTFFSKFHSFR